MKKELRKQSMSTRRRCVQILLSATPALTALTCKGLDLLVGRAHRERRLNSEVPTTPAGADAGALERGGAVRIEPFRVAVPSAVLRALHRRLQETRWPDGVTDTGGVALSRVQALCEYWRKGFDWRRQQARINGFAHFQAHLENSRVHFVHRPAANSNAVPLLLLHGWPSSFIEMLTLMSLLGDRFHLVTPSLPGFGFSGVPRAAGMSNRRIADILAHLMAALGYDRFGIHGGDVGAGVATWMARRHPARLFGIHLNYVPGSYTSASAQPLADHELAFFRSREQWVAESGAYASIQRTRPLTLAYGMSDSPAGLLAWIAEKFQEWAAPTSTISDDAVLTNVTIYWITNTFHSSVRMYLESAATPLRFEDGEKLAVPCGLARFPYELPCPPRSYVERAYDVQRWTEMPRGGHFPALEEPALLADDIAAFFEQVI